VLKNGYNVVPQHLTHILLKSRHPDIFTTIFCPYKYCTS